MGIFNFYSWFRKNFSKDIYKIQKSIKEVHCELKIDNLMIDCNGLFHTSAQKVFKYGNYKPPYNVDIKENRFTQQQVYNDVCQTIENILFTVNPCKKLILCVDGPAPGSKINQQRKRRFKAAADRKEDDKSFDSNKISPGTEFMDHLCRYIDWFIRSRLSDNPIWQDIEVIYSSSNVPSEGEQKIMSYLRKHGNKNESFIIHGLDADLIMLSLLSHYPKSYVLRDDTFDKNNNFLLIDITSVRNQLIEIMRWKSYIHEEIILYKFDEECVINDFVFLCFLCGNDFLPNIPTIEIIEGGIEVILQVYKQIGEKYGHITRTTNGNIVFCKTALSKFLEIISESEKELLEQKFSHRHKYFPDELLNSCSSYDDEKYIVDIEKFRIKYNDKHFGDELNNACQSYLVGLQWILSYYTKDVPSWRWFYPYHYAPPASSLIQQLDIYERPRYHRGNPYPPFLQLLSILPPKSSSLLPKNMQTLLNNQLKKYCPDVIDVDLSGKKQEYQGIVLLPFMDYKTTKTLYDEYIEKIVDNNEKKRNLIGKSYIFKYNPNINKIFYSSYGNIVNCKVEYRVIDL